MGKSMKIKCFVVFLLSVCLLGSGSVEAQDRVLSVEASETERLRNLLSGQRIEASLSDGAYLRGLVQDVQQGLLRLDIENGRRSAEPRLIHGIPLVRISTVQFTRYESNRNRVRYASIFAIGGIFLTAAVDAGGSMAASSGILAGMGTLGYFWGRTKDKQNITVQIEHPPRNRLAPNP